MVYINIPYVTENERIDRASVAKELEILDISEDSRYNAFAAIYNIKPRGVVLNDMSEAVLLEAMLKRLGIPYRRSDEPEYV